MERADGRCLRPTTSAPTGPAVAQKLLLCEIDHRRKLLMMRDLRSRDSASDYGEEDQDTIGLCKDPLACVSYITTLVQTVMAIGLRPKSSSQEFWADWGYLQ